MKVLRIAVLALFVISALPLEGFCVDGENTQEEHHHGVMVCHSACQITIPVKSIEVTHIETVYENLFFTDLIYEEPLLSPPGHPPKHVLL